MIWTCRGPDGAIDQNMKKKESTNKQSHPVRNGVVATVIGGVILATILPVRDLVANAVSLVAAVITWVWTTLTNHYAIPGWIAAIGGLFAIVGLIGVLGRFQRRDSHPYHHYTEDMIDGAKWRWAWTGDRIADLQCFCPTCDAQLVSVEGYGSTDFVCERCRPETSARRDHWTGTDRARCRIVATIGGGNRWYAIAAVEREILRRVRTGEFQNNNIRQ